MSGTEELQAILDRMDAVAVKTETAARQLAVDLEATAHKTEIVARRLAVDLEKTAAKLALDLEEARLLAAEDRIQISRLILLVQRLTQQGKVTLNGTQRLERTAAHVAQDLADSIERADGADMDKPGASADAAFRSVGETAAEAAAHLEET